MPATSAAYALGCAADAAEEAEHADDEDAGAAERRRGRDELVDAAGVERDDVGHDTEHGDADTRRRIFWRSVSVGFSGTTRLCETSEAGGQQAAVDRRENRRDQRAGEQHVQERRQVLLASKR